MLNYSWKASQNLWGRLEFNSSFSIGFENGLMDMTLIWQNGITHIYMIYTWYIHRYACIYMHVFVYTKTCLYIHAYPCIYKDMDVHTWYIHQEPTKN